MEKRYEYVIVNGSCNGEEQDFADWITANYPNTEVKFGLEGYVFDREIGERVIEDDVYGRQLWDLYC